MARKDAYHDIVKNALEKDGWTITSEPLRLVVDDVGVQIDLGAEQQPIAAEKDGENIAVEIKSFVEPSIINEMGKQPERALYLAVPETAYDGIFSRPVVFATLSSLLRKPPSACQKSEDSIYSF